MSTSTKDVQKFLESNAKNKGNDREEMVFDKETMTLKVKNKEDVTAADRKVHLKMTQMFNVVVWGLLEKGEDYISSINRD